MNAQNARMERVLIAVARRYASALVPVGWTQAGDFPDPLPSLAAKLTEYGVLVIPGTLPEALAHQVAVLYRDFADAYTTLYNSLTRTLFPTFTQVSAFYADEAYPPIVGLYGQAIPVMMVLGEFVAPFVASRDATTQLVSDLELRGLVDQMLDELEAGDLSRDEYRILRDECVFEIKTILNCHVKPLALTPPNRSLIGIYDTVNGPYFEQTAAPLPEVELFPTHMPENLPELPDHAPSAKLTGNDNFVPPDLPEMEPTVQPSAAEGIPRIPIFFQSQSNSTGRNNPRRPPVPNLPE